MTTKLVQGYIFSNPDSDPVEINNQINIGSHPDCQIFINKPNIKNRHAKIYLREDKYIIKDLLTPGGTFVNGTQVLEAVLNHDDQIQIGGLHFVFSDTASKVKKSLFKSKNLYWNKVLKNIPEYANSEHSILLIGETGTGKDVLAQKIHSSSKRSMQPFVAINCGALSPNLIESELFGHIKGSFTGATENRKGAFQAAEGGTIFLDEIGELPLNLQPKLLRALENKEIKMVGSDSIEPINVRIIAATHNNIWQKIKEKQFREDLYYRLNTILIKIPSLNQRSEDITELLKEFTRKEPVMFSPNAIKSLITRRWSGNIRELKNFISRASVIYKNQIVTEHDLYDLLEEDSFFKTQTENLENFSVIDQYERDLILEKMQYNSGNQCLTARELNMPKSTLHDRLKKYKIDPKTFKVLL